MYTLIPILIPFKTNGIMNAKIIDKTVIKQTIKL